MVIIPPNLNLYFTAFDTLFQSVYEDTPTWQAQIASPFTCTTESWATAWAGMVNKLRIWKGARVTNTLAPLTYGATMLPFELTESIDQFKLDDDLHGVYAPLIKNMGMQSKKWPDYCIRDLIEANGDFSTTAFQTGPDGVSFWNSAHPVNFYDPGKGTYPNDYGAAGTVINGTTVGGAFGVDSYATVKINHATRKYENGERIGLQANLTMVPTEKEIAAKVVLQSDSFAPQAINGLGSGNFPTAGSPVAANAPFVGAMTNPLRGTTDLMVNFDLTSAAAWYVLTTNLALNPFGFILRTAPYTTSLVAATDPNVFNSHNYVYGVTARGTPIWTLPWLASRSGV